MNFSIFPEQISKWILSLNWLFLEVWIKYFRPIFVGTWGFQEIIPDYFDGTFQHFSLESSDSNRAIVTIKYNLCLVATAIYYNCVNARLQMSVINLSLVTMSAIRVKVNYSCTYCKRDLVRPLGPKVFLLTLLASFVLFLYLKRTHRVFWLS